MGIDKRRRIGAYTKKLAGKEKPEMQMNHGVGHQSAWEFGMERDAQLPREHGCGLPLTLQGTAKAGTATLQVPWPQTSALTQRALAEGHSSRAGLTCDKSQHWETTSSSPQRRTPGSLLAECGDRDAGLGRDVLSGRFLSEGSWDRSEQTS